SAQPDRAVSELLQLRGRLADLTGRAGLLAPNLDVPDAYLAKVHARLTLPWDTPRATTRTASGLFQPVAFHEVLQVLQDHRKVRLHHARQLGLHVRVERDEAGLPHHAGRAARVLHGEPAGVVAHRQRRALDDVPVGAGARGIVEDRLVLRVPVVERA